LYSFSGTNDGAYPLAGLVQGSDGNFYGTTVGGGTNSSGTVFKITTNGALISLYSFTGGTDGANPRAGLVQGSDGNFYGTTYQGGTNGDGTVFKITTNGAFTSLYSFTGTNDGANPRAGLVQGSDGNFYGTTVGGGMVFQMTPAGVLTTLFSGSGYLPRSALVQGSDGNFYGTTHSYPTIGLKIYDGNVFKISTNGVLTILYSFGFVGNYGADPNGLVQGSDGYFYGTTRAGGTWHAGTVFKITTNGALTSLHSFTGGNGGWGWGPSAGLVQGSDGNFYGTTSSGGTNGNGTVFKITTNGALTSLYSFTGTNDGGSPVAALVQGSDGNFYGTTEYGGTNGDGTVFKISTNGAFTSLYSFTDGTDGANPQAGLVQGRDGYLYGTTSAGGTNDYGTVFKISTNGAFNSLYSFTGATDGASPQAGLVQGSDGNFYGTTPNGGQGGVGTVFRLTIVPPALTIIPSGANVILTWPTDATGFTLQSTTNLASPAWITVTGQFAVTNPISGTQMFFRLKQ
jgi:uncharacterized repeat protein (TIGR03803 family)